MANDLAHRIAQLWLAAAGLLIAAVAFLIPAHISGIDSRVLDIVGEKGPTLTALAREHITAGNIGVAQMLLRASDAGLAPRLRRATPGGRHRAG